MTPATRTLPHSSESPSPPPKSTAAISIGEAAEVLGTTPRTLRYYEELGLVRSSRRSTTARRRYGPAEIERLRQIKELQNLLGLDLDEIGAYLAASDRLDELKAEYRSGPVPARRVEILAESRELLEALREKVSGREEALSRFGAELDARLARVNEMFGREPKGS